MGFELWDLANIIGISLEIIGFILLLPQLIRWLKKKQEIISKIETQRQATFVYNLIKQLQNEDGEYRVEDMKICLPEFVS